MNKGNLHMAQGRWLEKWSHLDMSLTKCRNEMNIKQKPFLSPLWLKKEKKKKSMSGDIL